MGPLIKDGALQEPAFAMLPPESQPPKRARVLANPHEFNMGDVMWAQHGVVRATAEDVAQWEIAWETARREWCGAAGNDDLYGLDDYDEGGETGDVEKDSEAEDQLEAAIDDDEMTDGMKWQTWVDEMLAEGDENGEELLDKGDGEEGDEHGEMVDKSEAAVVQQCDLTLEQELNAMLGSQEKAVEDNDTGKGTAIPPTPLELKELSPVTPLELSPATPLEQIPTPLELDQLDELATACLADA